MTQFDGGRMKSYWNQSNSIGWMLFFVLLKMLFMLTGAMLLVPLVLIVFSGSDIQAHGQSTPSSASSSVPESTPDLPDAPSVPSPKNNSQSSIPFLVPHPGQPAGKMDVGDKFKYFVEPSFGPRAFVTTAFGAGIRMANPPSHYPREWHSGAEAFGRLYGDSFARNGAESIGRFSTSVLLHEDPRYRRFGSTSFPLRLGHALAFTLVDRTDGGRPTVALSNFTGAAASGFIGNAYLPAGFDNLTHAGQRSAVAFGGIAGQNLMQEFAPDLALLLRKIHLPHIPVPPVWWTGDK